MIIKASFCEGTQKFVKISREDGVINGCIIDLQVSKKILINTKNIHLRFHIHFICLLRIFRVYK